MLSPRPILLCVAGLVVAAIVFGVWPSLDLTVAGLFVRDTSVFVGQGDVGNVARRVLSTTPIVIPAVMLVLWVARRLGLWRFWAPNAAGVAMMGLSLALGPWLLVNVGFKDHSHRPRPYLLRDFGGTAEFRPFYRFDGSCRRNCSFPSGEGATGFWTVAPALLAPPAARVAAVAAALVFGTATSLLRIAFGGHFLSDTVFAGLLTFLVIALCWRLVTRVMRQEPGGLPPPP